jgi:hypothetical protein
MRVCKSSCVAVFLTYLFFLWLACRGSRCPATVACPCALGAAWALYLLLNAPPCCLYLAGQQQVLELEFI